MKHLTKEQRYVISSLYKREVCQKEIAVELGVHKNTINGELSRNRGKRGGYSPSFAHALSEERKERFKRYRKFTSSIEKRCRRYLEEEQWSPEEIKCKRCSRPNDSLFARL